MMIHGNGKKVQKLQESISHQPSAISEFGSSLMADG
jgi:hypothetical protein